MVDGSVVVLVSGTLIVLLAWVQSSAGLFSLWQSFVWNWRILDIVRKKKICPSFFIEEEIQYLSTIGMDQTVMHFKISGFTHVGL